MKPETLTGPGPGGVSVLISVESMGKGQVVMFHARGVALGQDGWSRSFRKFVISCRCLKLGEEERHKGVGQQWNIDQIKESLLYPTMLGLSL